MASPRVLVVDNDLSSLGLLTHGMNRFGLSSSGVADLEEARAMLASQRPDVVVSEVGSGPGLAVLEEMRRNPATRDIPVVLLAKGAWARRRAHARELGAQELIAKPAYVQDVAVLTWLYAGRAAGDPNFEGAFGEPSCAALLRGLLAGGRSGTLQLQPSNATVRFSEGAIIDATMPPLTGERALMRILTLSTGSYELSFGPLDTPPNMKFELSDLSGRGLRHVHNWEALQAQLQPLDQVLTVDYHALSGQVNELPPGLWSLLRLFDGKRTVGDVIEDSSLDELITGQAVAKLKGLEIFEQQRQAGSVRREERLLADSSMGNQIGALPVPLVEPASLPESWQPEYQPEYGPEYQAEYDAEYSSQAALDAHARVEESFFDAPADDLNRDVDTELRPRSGGFRIGGWGGVAAALAFAAVLVLAWNSTPHGDQPPPTAAIGPVATAPVAVAPVAPPVAAAAVAQPVVAAAPVAAPAAPEPVAAAPTEAAAAPAPSNPAVNTLLAEAQKDYDKGKFQKALALYEQANAIAPEDPAIALGRGLNYYELGDLDHASAALTKALELDGKSARAELMLGAIAQERRQNDMAKQHYKRYLELDPKGEHAAETRELLKRLGG